MCNIFDQINLLIFFLTVACDSMSLIRIVHSSVGEGLFTGPLALLPYPLFIQLMKT